MDNIRLCIDLGNSRTKLGLFLQTNLLHFASFDHNETEAIHQFLNTHPFHSIIYCSVLNEIPSWLENLKNHLPTVKLDNSTALPIDLSAYETPETLGADRIAALAGAYHLHLKTHVLVINAGTCTTFDLISPSGQFFGGNISPGLEMRYQAMHHYTAKLPWVHPNHPSDFKMGLRTTEALENGGYFGLVFEMEGYFHQLQENYPDLKCVLTGGSAHKLVNRLKIKIFADPYLVLKGLNYILDANEKI